MLFSHNNSSNDIKRNNFTHPRQKKKSSKSLKRNKNSLFSAVKEDKYHPQNKKSLKRIRMKLLTS